MLNYLTEGRQWLAHGVTRKIVEERNHVIAQGSQKLWDITQEMLIDAERKGYLKSASLLLKKRRLSIADKQPPWVNKKI